MNRPIRIALLASGNGTNVQQIAEYLADKAEIEVCCVLYNRKEAYVAQRAKNLGIEAQYFNRHDFMETDKVVQYLAAKQADWLILAGFLLLIPDNLLKAYPQRIVNIHPALLPNYGGKGMYGHHVHEAVVARREPMSGITIHMVDEHYDHGTTLFQARCKLQPSDTADDLAVKIHILEKTYYPRVVEAVVTGGELPRQEQPLE